MVLSPDSLIGFPFLKNSTLTWNEAFLVSSYLQ